MTAELIAVGTELLLGNIVNLDAQIISEALAQLGVSVYYHTVVGDNPERLKAAIDIARNRADIIITTGGLGPTYDDLTKQTLAAAFGKKLVRFPEEEKRVRSWFEGHGFPFPENNLQQADFPEGCEILANPQGTAPGCAFVASRNGELEIVNGELAATANSTDNSQFTIHNSQFPPEGRGTHVLMLPGPPRECRAMLNSGAIPYIKRLLNDASEIVSHTIHIIGVGESAAEERLNTFMRERGLPIMKEMTNPSLAPYAKEGEVHLRVTAKAATTAEAEAMMQPVIKQVQECFGTFIYGIDCKNLETRLVQLLTEQGKTLAVAESVTGGWIAKRITDVSGASKAFNGGIVAYTDSAKMELLDVSAKTLNKHTAVSDETAREMALGALAKFGADIAVATTGYAEPSAEQPQPRVFVAVAFTDGSGAAQTDAIEITWGRDRDQVRNFAANMAINMVRMKIAEQ